MTNNQDRPIADIAKGHWRELLPQLGVDKKYLTGKHGPCPMCGGTDRFRFTDKDGAGMYICSVCGANDGFKLVQAVTGQTFAQVAKQVSKIMGERPTFTPKDRSQEEVQRQAIKRIWEASGRPSKDGPVVRYLNRRIGLVWASKSVREFIGQNHCLMVSQIVGPDNNRQIHSRIGISACHRTAHRAERRLGTRALDLGAAEAIRLGGQFAGDYSFGEWFGPKANLEDSLPAFLVR